MYIASSPLLELRTTWIRLGKLVHSGTKFRPGIYKFHLGHFHHPHPHHHQHHHQHHRHHHHHHHHIIIIIIIIIILVPASGTAQTWIKLVKLVPFTWTLTSCRKFTWTLTSHPTPHPTPRVRSINCCRKFTWTLTSHPTPPHPACALHQLLPQVHMNVNIPPHPTPHPACA